MKILLVIDHLGSGGAQHQMVTLAASLVHRGHDVSCFVYYPEIDHHRHVLDECGVDVYSIQKPSRFSLRVPLKLRKIVQQGFDVSLSYLTTPSVYNVLSTIGTDVPVIVSERIAPPSGGIGFGSRMWHQFYRLADRIVVNSEYHRETIAGAFPWMKPKLTVIRNGVDLDRFSPPERPRMAKKRSLDLLAVGGVSQRKNMVGLIEAMHVHRNRFGWTPHVRWVGRRATRDVDINAFEQAEQLIDRHDLRSSWEWLGVRRDVPDMMKVADALVHPSLSEGLPNVICEALASGLPVLAGRVCDHPWLVGEGERGLLFDPTDPSDIVLSIQQFSACGQAEREAMSRRARSFAEERLSLEKLTSGYEDLFRALVG